MTMRAALDIGGTKIAMGLVDGLQVVSHATIPTCAEMGPLAAIERIVKRLHGKTTVVIDSSIW